MAKIGDVTFNVLDESRSYDNNVSQHPVEDGVDITDHVKKQPRSYTINGVVGDDDDPAIKHSKLISMWSNGEIVKYVGRAILNNCVISNLNTNVSSESITGFNFSMTLTEVRIAKPSTVGLLPARLKVDMKEVGNAGRVQTR